MRSYLWIKIIGFGVACSVFLSLISLLIDEFVRPQREMLAFNLKPLVYLVVLTIAAVAGCLVSLVILFSRSYAISVIAAAFFGVTVSFGTIRGAYDLYSSADFFDAPMFWADLVYIGLNLTIYPLVCILTLRVFKNSFLRLSSG